jgi:hypothetical protein
MGPMTKLLNPLVGRMAGRRHVNMAALVMHRGRVSGREYATPAGARLSGERFVVPLTFGSESDWSRNLRAAGGGRIRWRGDDYDVGAPDIYLAKDIRPLLKQTFRGPERMGFKFLGIKSFMCLEARPRT